MSQVINSPNQVPDWDAWDKRVRKIVLGPSPGARGEDAKPLRLAELPENLAERFPQLTHLYLWRIEGLKALPPLPATLNCLDARGCSELTELPALPAALETLVLESCPLATISVPECGFLELEDLSLKGCASLAEAAVNHLLGAAPRLRRFDASDCPQIERIQQWPETLERIELNGCTALIEVPQTWPMGLYRFGARGVRGITRLGDFKPESVIDHVDLADAAGLRSLPAFGSKPPRTLFLHGSGVDLEPELLGESPETNVAADVFADLGEAAYGRTTDHEVKVILLGNGRSGKTSLARRLAGQKFNRREESTHGVRLWTLNLPFTPVDEPGEKATAKLNIWDFGGQHLYQNTHRLFLQNRAVFVICGTDAGPGADDAGDQEAERRHDREEDIDHGYAYWQEQVDALGTSAKGERPPVIVLTTKADRPAIGNKWTRSIAEIPSENRLEISAKKPGSVLRQLEEMLAEQVAHLLGRRGERTLGKRPAKVKAELAALKAANEKAWSRAEAQGRRATPEHAKLSFKEAERMIQRHCRDGAYFEHPELLLRRLHRAGFLYRNESYLPDAVILEQRWAIDGIYTVLNRNSRGYGYLKDTRGLFTPRDLAEWEWNDAGYSGSEQALFLRFMESCGVAIQLLESYQTGGQPCYMAPGFLPPAIRAGFSAPEGAEVSGTPLRNIESHVVIRLFQAVALRQGREFERWKWGLKCSDDTAPKETRVGETLWAEWTPTSPEGVTGDLKICIKTRDRQRSYYAALVREVLGEFESHDTAFLGRTGEFRALARQEVPSLAKADARIGFEPLPPLLRVNTSFSGDPAEQEGKSGSKAKRGSAPQWRHTAFPTALRQVLEVAERRKRGGYRVLDYQANEAKRIASLRELMAQLVRGDVLIVVLSRRYFESPYCMQELFEIARKLEEKAPGTPPEWKAEVWKSEQARIVLYWLPDAAKPARDHNWKTGLKTVWERSSAGFISDISQTHFHSLSKATKAIELAAKGCDYFDKERKQPIPDLGPCVCWYAASDTPEERQKVIGFLDALIERTALPASLLNDPPELQKFANKEADELADKSRLVHGKLPNDERRARYEEEIKRALSASDTDGQTPVITLFYAWLKLSPESKAPFEALDPNPPANLPEPIQRAWKLVIEQQTGEPGDP